MSARQDALAYFISMGWSPAQAAGIVANLVAESDLNPAAVGDGGQAYGIAQWHGDRQRNFAALIGKDIRESSLAEQLAFVHAELNDSEKAAGEALRQCTTAREAGATVSRRYERPADTEGEATRRGALAETILAEYQGITQAQPAPVPTTKPGAPMGIAALLQIFGPILSSMIPQVGKVLNPPPGSTQDRNLDLAQIILDTIVKATAAAVPPTAPPVTNVQGAVEALQADKELQKKVQTAVVNTPEVMQVLEVGGGVAAARAQDLKVMESDKPFWKSSAVFWVSIMLLPLVYWLVGSLIVGGMVDKLPPDASDFLRVLVGMFGAAWTGEARSGGFNLVIGLVLGGICGVYFGVSVTQGKQQQQASTGSTSVQP